MMENIVQSHREPKLLEMCSKSKQNFTFFEQNFVYSRSSITIRKRIIVANILQGVQTLWVLWNCKQRVDKDYYSAQCMEYNPRWGRQSQLIFLFLTLKRIGETEYPSSLIYPIKELCIGLKTIRKKLVEDNSYQNLINGDWCYWE